MDKILNLLAVVILIIVFGIVVTIFLIKIYTSWGIGGLGIMFLVLLVLWAIIRLTESGLENNGELR